MGLLIYDALVLAKTAATIARTRRALTLGVPTLNFTPEALIHSLGDYPDLKDRFAQTLNFKGQKDFFSSLGFSQVDALDISDYEGANIVGDLNDPDLASRIEGTYDLVYDSGTIEHIFDAPTALRNLARLVGIGGAIVHATPANGFMDHGLWQLSPDLFRTFYREAGFSILTSAVFVFADSPYAMRADENFYRKHGRKYIVEHFPEAVAVFAAIKTREVASVRIGMQDYYQSMHGDAASGHGSQFFLSFGSGKGTSQSREAAADPAEAGLRGLLAGIRRRISG